MKKLLKSAAGFLGTNASIVAMIVAWELFVSVNQINAIVMPSPMSVATDIVMNVHTYLTAAISTSILALVGLIAGTAIGASLAILCWSSPMLAALMSPVTLLVTSVPIVTLVPLIARIFGYGHATIFAIVSILTFFPSFVFGLAGLKRSMPIGYDLFKVFGSDRTTRFRRLTLPLAVPTFIVSVRLTAPAAILFAMLGEFLIGSDGLGFMFRMSGAAFDTNRAFGASFVATLISLATFQACRAAEKAVVERWT